MSTDGPFLALVAADADLAGVAPACTVTTGHCASREWWPRWEYEQAKQRVLVREVCAAVLADMDGLDAARRGRPVTAVAAVMGLSGVTCHTPARVTRSVGERRV